MVNTVNKIPSINLPLTNEQGIIHPIWYEFLRSFISSVGQDSGGSTSDNTVVAGAGIIGTGAVSTVNVGQGEGISVGADSVSVNIIGQVNAQAAMEDEIMISDASDQSRIRKTSLRDVAALTVANPGGASTNIQYNNNGVFGGDSSFNTNGSGSVSITGDLTVDSLNFNGNVISSTSSVTPVRFEVAPGGTLIPYVFTQSGIGNSAMTFKINSPGAQTNLYIESDSNAGSSISNATITFGTDGAVNWGMGLADTSIDSKNFIFSTDSNLNSNIVYKINSSTRAFSHETAVTFNAAANIGNFLYRKTTTGITASTTQTQGQQPLTAEVNVVSTVANANDVVTLPTAAAGKKAWVINTGANTLQIFPDTADNLGAGLNTSVTLAAGLSTSFLAYDATNWKQGI